MNVIEKRGPALILHWGKGPILMHIESALCELGYDTFALTRSAEDIPEIVLSIEQRKPALCITRQRLYDNTAEVSQALAAVGCRTLFVDLGVWPHYGSYLMDGRGENAASSLVGAIAALEADPEIRRGADRHLGEVAAMTEALKLRATRAEGRRDIMAGLDLPGAFTLLVLQREGDQVLIYDAPPIWRDPAALARAAISEAERSGAFVVIKAHPQSSAELGVAERGPHHRLIPAFRFGGNNDLQLAWLMSHARNNIVVNSTCHFQTLALGIPTTCLGRGWFTGNRVVLETEDLADAFANGAARDGGRYLSHLMSRQMPVPDFAEPEKLDRLMTWLNACDEATTAGNATKNG